MYGKAETRPKFTAAECDVAPSPTDVRHDEPAVVSAAADLGTALNPSPGWILQRTSVSGMLQKDLLQYLRGGDG